MSVLLVKDAIDLTVIMSERKLPLDQDIFLYILNEFNNKDFQDNCVSKQPVNVLSIVLKLSSKYNGKQKGPLMNCR